MLYMLVMFYLSLWQCLFSVMELGISNAENIEALNIDIMMTLVSMSTLLVFYP